MIGRLVGGFVAVIIGVSLVPVISKEVAVATNSDEYKEDYEKDKKDKKKSGTYEEYVKEKLKVERMIKYGWLGRWI